MENTKLSGWPQTCERSVAQVPVVNYSTFPVLDSRVQFGLCLPSGRSVRLALWAPPGEQLLEGDASRQSAPQKQQQPTSKEFHWWNVIINLYPTSLVRVLPSAKASLSGMGRGEGRREGWFAKYKLTTYWSLTHVLLFLFDFSSVHHLF